MSASKIRLLIENPQDMAKIRMNHDPSPGFWIIKLLHQSFGVSYGGYYQNTILRTCLFITTFMFLTLFILINIPCLFHCEFDIQTFFSNGVSPEVPEFIIFCITTYQVIGTVITLVFRGSKLHHFFDRIEDYTHNFGVELFDHQKKKLTAVAARVVFYNILNLTGQMAFLSYILDRHSKEISTMDQHQDDHGNDTKSHSSEHAHKETYNYLSRKTFDYAYVILTGLAVIHSEIIETHMVYISAYLTQILKRLEVRFDKFIYNPKKGGRKIEVAKVAYIEVQNLIKEADEIFSSPIFEPLFMDIIIVMLAIYKVCSGVKKTKILTQDDWFNIYHSFAEFLPLFILCVAGDEVAEELMEVNQAIGYINGEGFTESDYRSVSRIRN